MNDRYKHCRKRIKWASLLLYCAVYDFSNDVIASQHGDENIEQNGIKLPVVPKQFVNND